MGNITDSCRQEGVSITLLYQRLHIDQEYKKRFEACRARGERKIIDLATSKLLEKIEMGDTTAIIYCLKSKGKHEGWGDRLEIQHNVEFTLPELMKKTDEELKRLMGS